MALRLGDGVERLPGIGPARARSLEKLGLATVEDLLRYFPRDYEDRRRFSTVAAAPVDTPVCLELLVAEPPHLSRIRKGLELVKARLVDDTGSVTATFFNQSYMKDALRTGETYVVYGRVEGPPGRRQMTNPVCERADRARFTGRILPIYPLTRGISNNLLAGLTLRCVEECAGQMEETLPAGLRREHALAAAEFACRNIHFPRDEEALELARRFDAMMQNVIVRHRTMHGGQKHLKFVPVASHVALGGKTIATPNGRRAGVALSEGISPTQGTDENGPITTLNAVAAINSHAHDLTMQRLLNIKLSPAFLEGESGIQNFIQIIRTFVDRKLWHIQFNVVNRETLLAAQKDPDKYRNLVVRVAGYCAYFTDLSEKLQTEIINRTEHTSMCTE